MLNKPSNMSEGAKVQKPQSQQTTRTSIFANLSLFQFLSFVRRGVFYTFMINYIFDLMQTVTYTTILGTLDAFASALGQNLLWGRIADRYKLKTKLIIIGESIAAISYFLVFQIHKTLLDAQANFQAGLSLILGLSILEFFWSMSDVGWAALLTEATTTRTRAKTIGTLNFIASLGRMIGINFAGSLYNNGEGFRHGTIFYIVITMLVVGVAIMFITSRSAEKIPAKPEKISAERGQDKTIATQAEKPYRWFLFSLIIIIIGASCVNQVFLLFIQLQDGLKATSQEMSLILTAFTIGGMLISLTCGWLADKVGKNRVLFIGLILAVLTPSLYGLASSVPAMAVIYGLSGVSLWIILTLGFAIAGDLFPEEKRGQLFSRYNAVVALSWGPAGLLVGGPLADLQVTRFAVPRSIAYVNTFYISSILVAVGMIVFALTVVRRKPKLPKF